MAGFWDPKRVLMPPLCGDQATITWDEQREGFGWRRYNGGGSTVYTHAAGLPGLVIEYAMRVLRSVSKITSSAADAREFIESNAKLGTMDAMVRFEPPLLHEQAVAARLQFGEDVVRIVLKGLRHLEDRTELTDGEFLGRLQVCGRDYKKNCAICLAEDIMGTTCTCGHTEIVVFRPCGHSLCVDPCFEQLVSKMHNLRMNDRTQIETSDGQRFTLQKHDVRSMAGFPCPMCRSNVDKCFRAEDAVLGSGSSISIQLRAYAAGFSFEAIPDKYLTAARQMIVEEQVREAAQARLLRDEHEAQRQEMMPIVSALVHESLDESNEQQLCRRGYEHAGKWHWGLLERATQPGFLDSWSSYHLLKRFHSPKGFRRFYANTSTWTCCGGTPHDGGCQPCPHIGYRCQCGDGAPAPISTSDGGTDPSLALSNQDIAAIYEEVLSPGNNSTKKRFKVKDLFQKKRKQAK